MVDLWAAVALMRSGRPADLLQGLGLIDWVTAQAKLNHRLLPELYDPVTSLYAGQAPMLGFGAGMYLIALHERAKALAQQPPPGDGGPGADGGPDGGLADGGDGGVGSDRGPGGRDGASDGPGHGRDAGGGPADLRLTGDGGPHASPGGCSVAPMATDGSTSSGAGAGLLLLLVMAFVRVVERARPRGCGSGRALSAAAADAQIAGMKTAIAIVTAASLLAGQIGVASAARVQHAHGAYRSGTRVSGPGGRSVTHVQGPRGGATHVRGYSGTRTTAHSYNGNRYYGGHNYGGGRYYGGSYNNRYGGRSYYGGRGYGYGRPYARSSYIGVGGIRYARPVWAAPRLYGFQRYYAGYPGWHAYGSYYGLVPGLAAFSSLAFLSAGMLIGSYAQAQQTVYVYVVQEGGQDVEYRVDGAGNVLSRRFLS